MAYPQELVHEVLDYLDSGHSVREAERRFGVGHELSLIHISARRAYVRAHRLRLSRSEWLDHGPVFGFDRDVLHIGESVNDLVDVDADGEHEHGGIVSTNGAVQQTRRKRQQGGEASKRCRSSWMYLYLCSISIQFPWHNVWHSSNSCLVIS